MNVCHTTVSRILKRTERRATSEQRTFEPRRKTKCGRKRKTTPRDEKVLLREKKETQNYRVMLWRLKMKDAGISISDRTVRKRLLENGRPARRPVKKQLLTETMKKKRYYWAKKYKHWTTEDWRKVVFSDESHFLFKVSVSNMSDDRLEYK